MPPTRTIPPAKAVKTERTHEENQERAYIAASRRSDRSLEARVESARRASEIHKRRTGRSLRVTEQDVINEEMYEEEDDDLPLQYRRLTAHLQTGSADFNRRLSAYLTNHVAIRTALGQAITNSYAQDYPNAPQFANQQPMFPSPMLAHQQQQQQQMMQQSMQQPSSPSMHRQAPYPSPRPQQQGFQAYAPHRSASIASPHFSGSSQTSPVIAPRNERRSSMPVVPMKTESPDQIGGPISPSTAIPQMHPSFPQGSSYPQQNQPNQYPLPYYEMGAFGTGYSPFSTALPAESQMLLGSALPNDPYTSMMMAGSSNFPGQFFDFNNSAFSNTTELSKGQVHPSYSGIYATLAPSALDVNQEGQSFLADPVKTEIKTETSPGGTPGVGGEPWNSFIDTDQWETPTSSQ